MATYEVLLEKSGNLEVADDVAPGWYICNAPYGLTLLGVALCVKTPGQGASIMIDIEKSTNGTTWSSIFGEPFLYGTHTSGSNASTLTDSNAHFTDALEGLIIDNASDGSSGIISSGSLISSTSLYVALSGGAENDWDTTDGYTIAIAGGIQSGEYIGIGGTPTVTELNQGELLRLDVEQCGVSPNPGADLTVSLRVRQ